MSHELCTPLTALIGYADLLDAEVAGGLNARQKEQVHRITTSARHLLSLIDQILRYTRIEAGREEIALERYRPGDIVREVSEIVEPLAEEKGLTFRARVDGADTPIVGDAIKLRHILLSLLSNAIRFTDTGEVELMARLEADRALFTVRDAGIGIATENLEKVFEPFWQVEPATTRRVGGTGLGLSLARRLARMLGGDVTVSSRSGVGSTFTVEVPAAREGQGDVGGT